MLTRKNRPVIIWIDQNINSKENQLYLKKLGFYNIHIKFGSSLSNLPVLEVEENNKFDIHPYESQKSAIDFLKTLKFNETIIIVSGRCFVDFVMEFNKNLKYIYVIPKIIVFTLKGGNYIFPKNIQINENFYRCGGNQTSFEKIQEFIEERQKQYIEYPQKSF